GQADGLIFYVMPHVEGETLRDRLTRERELPVAEAVEITRALASALDYAHRKGVIHRDIKPENILFQDGQPVVADFGIALAVSAAGESRLTESGLSLGTPLYMSPEQLTGERILDARSDVYALACVAYEMLAGTPPFAGHNVQAIIAAVMTQDAPPLAERRRAAPAGVTAAIQRGLERLPADRFATAADFGAALTAGRSTPAPPRATARRTSTGVALIGVAGLALGLLVRPYFAAVPRLPVRRWNIDLPREATVALAGLTQMPSWFNAIALAPAGDHLAYVSPRGGTTALMVRALDGDSAVAIPGTDGAYHPFYSPDGAWIGFFAGNLLRKVSATGGNPITLAQVDRITGALWATNDRIFVLENEGFDLHFISASGASADSTVHLATQFGISDLLPGGQWAVGQLGSGQLALLSLANGIEVAVTRRGVLPLDSVRQTDLLFGTSPRLLPNGYLVYGTGDGFLTAMPFDAKHRRVLGESVPLMNGMRMEAGFGYADFAISRDGTLAYVQGNNQFYVNIAFVTPSGRVDTLPFPRGPYTQPRVSPDGKRLAVQERNPVGGWSLLLLDLATGARRVLDVQGNYRAFPASWLPSGRELMIGIWDPVQFVNYGARILSMETGKWTEIALKGASYMTVAPDGKSFVYSDWRTGDLYI
ncbi:MAG: protein kinase, partial [Gemmatimonadales bacterium]